MSRRQTPYVRVMPAVPPIASSIATAGDGPLGTSTHRRRLWVQLRPIGMTRKATLSAKSRREQVQQNAAYSITSLARANIVGGTSKARFLAVFKFRTISNSVACSIGKSAGFRPLRILLTNAPAPRQICEKSTP